MNAARCASTGSGDTIAAISTPIGEGGIGIVRLSGPDATTIADRIFLASDRSPVSASVSHQLHFGWIVVDGRTLDEALVSVMRAPRTYTREDVVEINCHGGIAATRAVLDALLGAGARLAERGEFTQRAFLNGRISLDQAKAVLDVVRAQTALGLEAAVDRLGGRFSDAIKGVREGLVGVLARLEVGIDFPDLEIEPGDLSGCVDELCTEIDRLLECADGGRLIREGLTVAIVGRPNVGKSTLLNALLAEDRAIVTPIPGTTRDTVEEIAAIGGVPVRLIDTAGWRETGDPVEAEGVRKAERAVARADLVLLLIDIGEAPTWEDRHLLETEWPIPVILVANKIDRPDEWGGIPNGPWMETVRVCARSGLNLDRLRGVLVELLLGGRVPARGAVLTLDAWERDLLRRMKTGLTKAAAAIRDGASADIVAEELRGAYQTAGELQGIDVEESILDAVFSQFCVGK